MTLHLAAKVPEVDRLPLVHRARTCTERILEADPNDTDARLLTAVHHLELDEIDRADLAFQQTVRLMPREIRRVFESMPLTASDPMKARFLELSLEDRAIFPDIYWSQNDPTPITPANENLLEYWKRLVLAELFFGNAEQDIHGWDTDPGRIFIRYGAPRENIFSPGAFQDLPGSVKGHPRGGPRGRFLTEFDFEPPTWTWNYRFHNLAFSVKFEDIDLHGTFKLNDESTMNLIQLRREVPAVLHDSYPGPIDGLYLAGAGIAGTEGKTQQGIYLGLTSWIEKPKGSWWEETHVEIVVRDDRYRKAATLKTLVDPENVYHPVPGGEMLLFVDNIALRPGKYKVTAFVEDRDTESYGSRTMPMTVHNYNDSRFQISDLELALDVPEGSSGPLINKLGHSYVPNPMGVVGDQRNLGVFYENYNLTPDKSGVTRFVTRYVVLPRWYVVSIEDAVRRGQIDLDDPIRYGHEGMTLGGLTLTKSNSSDILFPEENVRLGLLGRSVKGARVDLAGLETGEYALIVIIKDLTTNEEASARTSFQIIPDREWRAMLRARR